VKTNLNSTVPVQQNTNSAVLSPGYPKETERHNTSLLFTNLPIGRSLDAMISHALYSSNEKLH
jgi:hypothetical protein